MHSVVQDILAGGFLSVTYVGSLYMWNSGSRDDPKVIKRRFVSAFSTCAISVIFVKIFGASNLIDKYELHQIIGLRIPGLVNAIILPLVLVALLFLGPIVTTFVGYGDGLQPAVHNWWVFCRNYIVAPLTEEFTFRGCMIPILSGSMTKSQIVIISPLFFGVAHFHHMTERIRLGQSFILSFTTSLFQFSYTTVFGMISAFIFLRTGHLTTVFVIHTFCNVMGFPNFSAILQYNLFMRFILTFTYILGAFLFFILLNPLTQPSLFQNHIYV